MTQPTCTNYVRKNGWRWCIIYCATLDHFTLLIQVHMYIGGGGGGGEKYALRGGKNDKSAIKFYVYVKLVGQIMKFR